MVKHFTLKHFLMLILVISISTCKSSHSKENTEAKTIQYTNSIRDQEIIISVDNKGNGFEYELGDTTEYGENFIINIECLVTNKTDKDINYLSQSCNGLDYYLIIRPDSYKIIH